MNAVWYASRGAGAAALAALTATTVLGVVHARRAGGARWPRFVVDRLHRDLALAAVALLAVHVVTAVLDSFAPIGALDVVVPFRSAYRPLWLGLGALAFDVLAVVGVSSLLRRRLGYGAWRAVHWAAYACWPLAVVHGLGAGSDPRFTWMRALTFACVAAVAGAVAWRARPLRARLALTAAVAAACLLLVGWLRQGPWQPGWARRAGTPAALLPARATVAAAGLPRKFSASLSGRVGRRRSADGRRATVELALAFPAGVADVRITGPVTAAGVALERSRVTLGTGGRPVLYRGRVVGLAGTRIRAIVRRRPGDALRVTLDLELAGGDVSGRISAEPAR